MNFDIGDTITLSSQNGEEIDFNVIVGISLKGAHAGYYVILRPAQEVEGLEIGDDEALVFRIKKDFATGEEGFEIEMDDATIEAVFAEYNRLLEEQR